MYFYCYVYVFLLLLCNILCIPFHCVVLYIVYVKGKGHLITVYQGPRWGVEV
jgi:hypothetical protein